MNRAAAKVYREELILTESIIDALSLTVLGILNVIPCYGVNGFTEEHGKLLHDERVKTVAVGFDSDEAGRAASASLAERLITDGFTVKTPDASHGSRTGTRHFCWPHTRAGPGQLLAKTAVRSRSSMTRPFRFSARAPVMSLKAPLCATAFLESVLLSSLRFG